LPDFQHSYLGIKMQKPAAADAVAGFSFANPFKREG
jgi:hypothetical protein